MYVQQEIVVTEVEFWLKREKEREKRRKKKEENHIQHIRCHELKTETLITIKILYHDRNSWWSFLLYHSNIHSLITHNRSIMSSFLNSLLLLPVILLIRFLFPSINLPTSNQALVSATSQSALIEGSKVSGL